MSKLALAAAVAANVTKVVIAGEAVGRVASKTPSLVKFVARHVSRGASAAVEGVTDTGRTLAAVAEAAKHLHAQGVDVNRETIADFIHAKEDLLLRHDPEYESWLRDREAEDILFEDVEGLNFPEAYAKF